MELSTLLMQQPFEPAPPPSQMQSQMQGDSVSLSVSGYGSGNWWPDGLGSPSTSGAQNNVRYAYFPSKRRLAIEAGGQVAVYDTLDHQIGGVSQQQGGGSTVTFTSQYGVVSLADLPRVDSDTTPAPAAVPASVEPRAADTGSSPGSANEDIFAKIERLAELKQKGILSDEEFKEKKAELLARL